MNLEEYLASLPKSEWDAFAKRAKTTVKYLWQLKGGHRVPAPASCHKYVEASNGAVTLAELHPEVWGNKSIRDSAA